MQPVPVTPETIFKLDDRFIEDYRDREVPWGFGDLSYITFKRTYARKLTRSILFPDRPEESSDTESWAQCCRRVIEGMITIQKTHCLRQGTPWDEQKARRTARDAYDRLFHFKWTPPGRGLWMMGTDFVFQRSGAALNNCGFCSTDDIDREGEFATPFGWAFEMAMLGVGIGFDCRGAEKRKIVLPEQDTDVHTIGDSREGWRAAIERLLNAFVGDSTLPYKWDYSEIRDKGSLIRSFGGVASGPGPLKKAIETLTRIYTAKIGQYVDSELITDTFNITGRCVVAGGIRRSAQIALGNRGDKGFLDLKQKGDRPWQWVSNNSPFFKVGDDYSKAAERTVKNGDPGYIWLENAQKFGRMKDPPNWDDREAMGTNPCSEQTLENWELCCLAETYPAHHEDFEDLRRTLKMAYLYAKTVTLVPTHSDRTNAVMLKNRRIGTSQTGIVQSINRHGYRTHFNWCDRGYGYIQQLDRVYSDWLAVPRSKKTTSVKPSGTVSLLAGATKGVHWPENVHYLKRMRISENQTDLLGDLRASGYPMEEAVDEDDTVIVDIPVKVEGCDRNVEDVPVWEKVDLAAQMQHWWADNQVSCTAKFDPETEGDQIERVIESYEDRLKGMSFMPIRDLSDEFAQLPQEPLTEEEYKERRSQITPMGRDSQITPDQVDEFCDGEACEVDL